MLTCTTSIAIVSNFWSTGMMIATISFRRWRRIITSKQLPHTTNYKNNFQEVLLLLTLINELRTDPIKKLNNFTRMT